MSSSFKKSSISIDAKIFNSVIPNNDCFAIGLMGINEKSSSDGIRNDYILLSLAYQKGLDKEGEQQIGLGFQYTYGCKRIEPQTLYIFENQLNAWTFEGFSNINIFQLTNVNVSYGSLNTGVFYQGKVNNRNFISLSAAIHNANKPHKFFSGGELVIEREFNYHIGWENNPSERNKYYSFLLINAKNKNEIITGGLTYQSYITNTHYQIAVTGCFEKNTILGDFIIPMIGLKFRELFLNISYDINLSKKKVWAKGATELSLCYRTAAARSKFFENKFMIY